MNRIILRLALAALGAAWILAAQQPRSATVDVSASREVAPGALEAVFHVDATALASTGVAQVAAKLEPVGVRAEHLQRVGFQVSREQPQFVNAQPATATYSFEVRVPAARHEALALEMDRLFRQPTAPLVRFSFSANLVAAAAALESARLAVLPTLFEEARAQAEAALAAAGQTAGPVIGLEDNVFSGYSSTATATLSLRMARLAPGAAGSSSLGRSVSATATRRLTAPYDVAVISLDASMGTERALRELTPLGVTAADISSQASYLFANNNPFFDPVLTLSTSFRLTRPVTELPRFIEALTKISVESRERLGLSFSATLGHSPALRAREKEKAIPGLLEDARRRAEPLARLLNLPLGSARSIADSQSAQTGVPAFLLVNGDFGRTFDLSAPASVLGLAVEFGVD